MATTLDYRGLLCPLPVLKARKALKALPAGEEIEILATDKGAPADFVAFCETTGNAHLGAEPQADGSFVIRIRKG